MDTIKSTVYSFYRWGCRQLNALRTESVKTVDNLAKAIFSYENETCFIIQSDNKPAQKILVHSIKSPLYWKQLLLERLKQDKTCTSLAQLGNANLNFYLSFFENCRQNMLPLQATTALQLLYDHTKENSPLLCTLTLIFFALPTFHNDPKQRLSIFQQILVRLPQLHKKDLFFILVHFRLALKDEQELFYWNKAIKARHKNLIEEIEKEVTRILKKESESIPEKENTLQIAHSKARKALTTIAKIAAPIILIAFVSAFPGLLAAVPPSAKQFSKDLAHRNISFLKGERFSLYLYFNSYGLCSKNNCNMPSHLRQFKCADWNLTFVDYSFIEANNSSIVSQNENECFLQGSKFFHTFFHNATFHRANFLHSEIDFSDFSYSKGDASFIEIKAGNSSWKNIEGNFKFSGSLNGCDFRQDFPEKNITSSQTTTYIFTGAQVKEGSFQVKFPNPPLRNAVHPLSAQLRLKTDPHPLGTLFDNCNFTTENYTPPLDDLYPINIARGFFFFDTKINNSTMGPKPTPSNSTLPQLFYFGNFTKVSFSPDFFFSIPSPSSSCGWLHFYDISACGYPHMSESTISCLVPTSCEYLTVSNNRTLLHKEFVHAYKKQEKEYMKGELFDMHKYLKKQGLAGAYVNWINADFLYGPTSPYSRSYDRLCFDFTALNFSFPATLTFNNSISFWAYFQFNGGGSRWNNCSFEKGFAEFHGSTHLFTSSSLNDIDLLSKQNNTLTRISYSRFSQLGALGNGTLFNLEHSTAENSNYFNFVRMNEVHIHNCSFPHFTVIGGYNYLFVSNTEARDLHLYDVNVPSQSISFKQSAFLNITNSREALLKAEFRDITQLYLKADYGYSRDFICQWAITNVSKLHLDLFNTYISRRFSEKSCFKDIQEISGVWKGGGLTPDDSINCRVVNTTTESNIIANNALFKNMLLDNVYACCDCGSPQGLSQCQTAKGTKSCLEANGFTLENVTFINYFSPPKKFPYAAVIIPTVLGGFAIVITSIMMMRRYMAGGIVPVGGGGGIPLIPVPPPLAPGAA